MPPVKITIEADAHQAHQALKAIVRDLGDMSTAAERATTEQRGGWRGTVRDIRDIGVAAFTTFGAIQQVAGAISNAVDAGLSIQRATHALEV